MNTLDPDKVRERLQQHPRIALSSQEGIRAAVLVPLVPVNGSIHLLLTKRSDDVEHHKGQISFPGGAHDAGDTDQVATALRESFEEIGLTPESVEILGLMDDIRTPTGFVVTPVVGYIRSLPELQRSVDEVAEILLLPIGGFFDPANCRTEEREIEGVQRTIYFYDVGREPVWGLTAFFIRQLHTIVMQS